MNPDIRTCYQQTADNCVKYYYSQWNSNPLLIKNMYNSVACITYLNNKWNNFDQVISLLRSQNINKLEFITSNVFAQPIVDDKILINIFGTVTTNISVYPKKFKETIVLQRDIWNKYYIINSIFWLE